MTLSELPSFSLDPRLAADSFAIGDGPLSQLRMVDDGRFPWLILVPRGVSAFEWIDLHDDAQQTLLRETAEAGRLLRTLGPCDKLNIGALGNVVRQLHVHIVSRVIGDAAWPGPVWGAGSAERLTPGARDARSAQLHAALDLNFWRPAA